MDSLFEYLNPRAIVHDKREYKKMQERTQNLPQDYSFVFNKITSYMFLYATGTGRTVMAILENILYEFGKASAVGKSVLEITSNDVASYCDNLLHEAKIDTESMQARLNREIQEKLG